MKKFLAAVSFVFLATGLLAAQGYKFVDYSRFFRGESKFTGINDYGDVIGIDYAVGRSFIVYYGTNTPNYLPNFVIGSQQLVGLARAINNKRFVVGNSQTPPLMQDSHATGWQFDGPLALFGPYSFSTAQGVNNNGVVVGQLGAVGSAYRWFGTATLLTNPSGAPSGANAINDFNVAAGSYFDVGSGCFLACYWDADGTFHPIGSLGGVAEVAGISNTGLIVGNSALSDNPNPKHAFVWRSGLGMMDIGGLPDLNGGSVFAHDVNDSGEVVGDSNSSTRSTPYVWRDGQMRSLLTYMPGRFDGGSATGISNRHTIVGYSLRNGARGAGMWIPR